MASGSLIVTDQQEGSSQLNVIPAHQDRKVQKTLIYSKNIVVDGAKPRPGSAFSAGFQAVSSNMNDRDHLWLQISQIRLDPDKEPARVFQDSVGSQPNMQNK